MSQLTTNKNTLQNILDKVNSLPEASTGVELPELSNEGTAADLVSGKELIDQNGNKVTGTNPYEKTATDTQVNSQTDLIVQIASALEGKVASGGGSVKTCTVIFNVASDYYTQVAFYTALSERTPVTSSVGLDGGTVVIQAVAGSIMTLLMTARENLDWSYDDVVCTECEKIGMAYDENDSYPWAMVVSLPTSGTATIQKKEYSK